LPVHTTLLGGLCLCVFLSWGVISLFGGQTTMADWSQEEVLATVRDYMAMLRAELNGEKYVKAHHRRELLKVLDGRTEGAVERKHQNISAILLNHGHPYINGYKPLSAYQGLLEEVVLDELGDFSIDRTYPQTYRSWTVSSPTLATKQMDKSSFLHHGTGVPRDFGFFFDFDPTMNTRKVTLSHRGIEYSATLTPDIENTRTRLMWQSDLSQVIAETLPSYLTRFTKEQPVSSPPHMIFKKIDSESFEVGFVLPVEDESDREQDNTVDQATRSEGAKKTYQATRYERNPKNRLDAIRIHGTRCAVCKIDFGERYGSWGEGFIEVHHVNPLANNGREQDVDPATDLIPVCPNCHRMLHRHGKVLTIEAAKSLLQD